MADSHDTPDSGWNDEDDSQSRTLQDDSESRTLQDDSESRTLNTVSRADVARLLAAAPTTDGAGNRTFEVVSTPVFAGRAAEVDWRLPRRATETTVPVDVIEE